MSFLEKNLRNITEVIQLSLFAQTVAGKSGFLQRMDTRAKIICFISLLLAANLSRSLPFMWSQYGLLLLSAGLSNVDIKNFVLRVWLFLPFFTGIIAIPAVLNIVTPGPPVFTIVNAPQYHIYLSVTRTGVFSALFLLTRVAISVSLAILMVLTTEWTTLLKALEIIRVPRIFIAVTLMTYRYIFVLLKTAHDMLLARKSRTVGKPITAADRQWIGSSFGTLVGKTHDLSENVYSAMVSRGYRGTIYVLNDFLWRPADTAAVIGCLTAIGFLSAIFR